MSSPQMPPLYKLKNRAGYIPLDIEKNVVVPNNLFVTANSSIYGNLNVDGVSVFHDTVHINNTELNITTNEINVAVDVVTISTDVSVDTQKISLNTHDISIVGEKVSFVGSDITISIPDKKLKITGEVDITGDLLINNGDLILNGMSVGDLVSNTTRPIHQQNRFINPFCTSIIGGQIPPAPIPAATFLQGWLYSDLIKSEYNTSYNYEIGNPKYGAKINWFFPPGTQSTKMKDFKGVNVETTLYDSAVPFISIYTKHNPLQNNGSSWFQSRLNLTYGDLSALTGAMEALAKVPGLPATLTYGDYSNIQTLGFTNLPLIYDKDYSLINNSSLHSTDASKVHVNVAEAFDAIKDQEIFFYTIQTNSAGSNYNFVVHEFTFTETNTVDDRTFEVSFINVLQSIMG